MENQIIREITPLSEKDCFYIADRHKMEFTYPMHCHKEYELNFIEHGNNLKRIVGDSTESVGEWDLVLITSPDLEHVWEQGECNSPDIREITIQFSGNLFGNLLETNQFERIKKMLNKAQNGLCFPVEAIMKVYNLLDTLPKCEELPAVLQFITLLYELSYYTDRAKSLASSSFAKVQVSQNSRRIDRVQKYINENYRNEIRLEEISSLAGMTPVAFSRFFKLRTGKCLSDYIIGIRLGFASRMLVDSTMSISEICYASGFNNISNFNRLFKKNKKCSPKEFRENYQKKRILI